MLRTAQVTQPRQDHHCGYRVLGARHKLMALFIKQCNGQISTYHIGMFGTVKKIYILWKRTEAPVTGGLS